MTTDELQATKTKLQQIANRDHPGILAVTGLLGLIATVPATTIWPKRPSFANKRTFAASLDFGLAVIPIRVTLYRG